MEIIAHRRNTITELTSTPGRYGVEVDIRSYEDRLIVNHEPFHPGIFFEDWLSVYEHGTIILNVKEEGLEVNLIALMKGKGIENYFFLDQSFPFLIKFHQETGGRSAVRVSEYESLNTALAIQGMATWVWLDCFTKFPLDKASLVLLKEAGYRTCLVSPELQNRSTQEDLRRFICDVTALDSHFDAVCTKQPDIWEASRITDE